MISRVLTMLRIALTGSTRMRTPALRPTLVHVCLTCDSILGRRSVMTLIVAPCHLLGRPAGPLAKGWAPPRLAQGPRSVDGVVLERAAPRRRGNHGPLPTAVRATRSAGGAHRAGRSAGWPPGCKTATAARYVEASAWLRTAAGFGSCSSSRQRTSRTAAACRPRRGRRRGRAAPTDAHLPRHSGD